MSTTVKFTDDGRGPVYIVEPAHQIDTDHAGPPARGNLKFTENEIAAAILHPRCIVKDYLYADVACLSAPGGTGKTTLLLWEAVSIVLERSLYGLPVHSTGWALIITAEDSRQTFAARLREIMDAMQLSEAERAMVLDRVCLWDVTGEDNKLVVSHDGNLMLTGLADDIVKAYKDDPPVMIVFDPLVSFGADEERVNTNEQALITAARRLVRGLGCCVRLITHTGKLNARNATLDQYSARGGSALPDGCRMVAVLQTPGEDNKLRPPQGCTGGNGIGIFVMSRPKLSYAKPGLPLIWIRRSGFSFEHFTELAQSKAEKLRAHADQLLRFIAAELRNGRRYTRRALDTKVSELGMTRGELRAAITELEVRDELAEVPLPRKERQGRKQKYLKPSKCAEDGGAMNPETGNSTDANAPEKSSFINAPSYKDKKYGAIESADFPSPSFNARAQFGAMPRNGAIGTETHPESRVVPNEATADSDDVGRI